TLGYEAMAHSPAVAAETLSAVLPRCGGRLISALICISALGAVNGLTFAGARILYAVGRDHRLFGFLGRWDRRTGTPVRALLLQAGIALVLIVSLGSFEDTVIYIAATVYGFYLATSLAVIVLRRKEPGVPRPYRVTAYPLPTILFGAVCVWLIYSAIAYKPWIECIALAILLAGVPAYWLTSKRRKADS
ncbi:MAG: APC family permease, partial [Sedimentisphaerales bacterium]|nr:APC family permease [Sedimentisphaerales bacterium]